jgi:hypothetical protein
VKQKPELGGKKKEAGKKKKKKKKRKKKNKEEHKKQNKGSNSGFSTSARTHTFSFYIAANDAKQLFSSLRHDFQNLLLIRKVAHRN